MNLYCSAWDNDLELTNGYTVEDIYDENNCNFYVDCTANVDSDGTTNEHNESDNYQCAEHETEPSFYDDIYDMAYDRILRTGVWFACHDEEHDEARCVPLFTTLEALNDHVVEEHEQDEDDEAEAITAAHPESPAAAPGCTMWHPTLTPELRASVLTFIENQRSPSGLLVDPECNRSIRVGHMVTPRFPPNPGELRSYSRSWPRHFWISATDPHLIQSPNKHSIHAAWAQ